MCARKYFALKVLNMDLFEKLEERLAKEYMNYKTRIESENGNKYFVIVNPFWEENIRISAEDGIVFYFSYQHAHFDFYNEFENNVRYLIDYINWFFIGEKVAIEFFCEDESLFGGDRSPEDIDMSSGEALLKGYAGDNDSLYESLYEHLKGFRCRCSIRGWNCALNKDIDFVL